jgi:multidrug efflux pump subunit AcrA (membrane-fusion protein)
MRLPRSRRLILGIALLVGVPGAWLLARGRADADEAVVTQVKRGEFKVVVTTSGELRALKYVQINVPQNAQQANQYQMKISSIVPEGTVVKAGDIVAELDRSVIASRASDVSLALQKAQAVYEQAMLDSTLNLSKAREDMRTMDLTLEEKRLAKEQAVFEAPTVKRQAEIDLEKAQRALAQAKLDYKTRTEQAEAKMREVGADRDRQKNLLAVVQDVMLNFTIRAPAPGMVTYVKEWSGKKKTTGSQVNAWEPAVATLPDLTQMESITYVNEIDVRKVAVGQPAVITLDADPTKKLKGKVTAVANMGEQRPNQDAKVFEVKVVVEQADTTLRPGMTTGNAIQTYSIPQALFLPLEALNSEAGVPFVYKQSGGGVVKQEVTTGAMNDDEVIISAGLTEEDKVFLSPPADKDKLTLVRLPGSATPPKAGGDTALTPQTIPPVTTPAPAPAPVRPPAAVQERPGQKSPAQKAVAQQKKQG